MRWTGRIYNEFRSWIRITDHFTLMIGSFPVVMFRRYDWLDDEDDDGIARTYSVMILGFEIYRKIYRF